jgi:LCP family protein required for cell wall assembly
MRTTLKRGIGRGASANGNGRAVLPPAVLTPMTRYRQPLPPRRGGVWTAAKIFGWLLAVVLMLASAASGGAYLFFHNSVDAVRAHSEPVKLAQSELAKLPSLKEASIFLVLGYDRRPTDPKDEPSRSDTIMLLRADPQQHALSMLSFPRDMLVELHCPGQTPYTDKINAAYSLCGPRGTLATVKKLIAPIPINYLITVNFSGFKEIVDELSGVWIDVDQRYLNTNGGRTYDTYATINLWPGYQRLKGWQALDYVRFRHTDSDLLRVIRQQQFVRAMREQAQAHFGVTGIPRMIRIITNNVEVGVGGGGELSERAVFSFAKFLYQLPAGHFFQAKIQGLEGYSELTTDPTNIRKAIEEFANPDVEAPQNATDVALGRKLRTPRPEETSVVALNGNNVEGSAALASQLLAERGYKIYHPPNGLPANAPRFNYSDSIVYYNPGYKRAKAAARQLAKLFAPARVRPVGPLVARLSNAAMTVVTVGTSFHGKLTPITTPKPPVKQPPNVYKAPEVTLPTLQKLRKKFDFRLELPTLLESTSIADPDVPARVYYIDPKNKKHRTLRLTYRTGAREYWGIQMTDWEDAPVLRERNFKQFIKGREYDLFYSGGHLHMVVVKENGASYWVVNTLNDTLSNETMLAIARGLKPLPGQVGRG